ncbi:hypothetical protein [Bradyrhizobium cosmicum]|uniref:hypothetical protein n=1 Tax=Bradyrhizobium cosmicum TaxID=1404864 RepID=UPI00116580DD|nr:hypothetical protein [Bradyrhizobium cosmicum]QDP24069.1 hypothetical protein FNV92_18735 [Bradyrhizobium cosmicum]
MKILIIEASYPKDFYKDQLDGHVTRALTRLLGVQSDLLYALDKPHFEKAIAHAAKGDYDVVHISCHGDEIGIAVTNNKPINWPEFVGLFCKHNCNPRALVMSSCCGATDELANEFEKVPNGPYIIFGSIDERNYNEYAVAWTILYNLFKTKGVHRDVAMEALRAIKAVAHNNFRYLRWKDNKKKYVQYPPEGRRYVVMEKPKKAKAA